ncbi:gag/pol protein [Cucumis melo var. makuwa]|uniref:Gag/pol protein n=1 Tax=Cucumis melo var. makuwa TaxID=1194695 RepID=A0A5D3DF62_CUCMM|nr:gag/pol protein [Cucumis melo var. makuwa]TYK22222.1 gag/pol protein [Cucumis melo var. makuwa]
MRHISYASAVGNLMHAMLCTKPDIYYAVGIISRYQSNPGLAHWTAVKTILKYLKRTRDYMLVYGYKDLILIGYTDSDFQTDRDSRKYTSEYVGACEAAKEAIWLRKFLTDLELVPNISKPITLYYDNSGATVILGSPKTTSVESILYGSIT